MRLRSCQARDAGLRLGVMLLACAAGCWGGNDQGSTATPDRGGKPAILPAEGGGTTGGKVVYLEQNWTPAESLQFYYTSQGSQILPYDWFLILEQAGNKNLLRDDANLSKFGYLLQNKDSKWNPDGLPIGFVRDKGRGRDWLGFNCSACHTSQLDYQGVGYRVDGGTGLADVQAFLTAVADSLKATRDQDDKFRRFSAKVLGTKDKSAEQDTLKSELTEIIKQRDGYNARNFDPTTPPLPGRVDALGAILNEVFHGVVKDPNAKNTENSVPANAPVSYPCLWDTPQHNVVQWNGAVVNTGLGPLGRNVGEVLGVFGKVEIPDKPSSTGYSSTVQVRNLLALEDWVKTLWSPQWPAGFPPIDAALRDQGKEVYKKAKCASCHEDIDRKDPFRRVQASMVAVGTEDRVVVNFLKRVSSTGKLEGAYKKVVGSTLAGSEKFKDKAGGDDVLSHVVIGTILGSPYRAPEDELTAIDYKRKKTMSTAAFAAPQGGGGIYKARPLNGVWATAPYLHNGSVPTLYDMLLPPKERPRSFSVGSREFDPKKVGFKTDAKDFPVYKARIDDGTPEGKPVGGNSNEGHDTDTWAKLTDPERWALVEYLKSL